MAPLSGTPKAKETASPSKREEKDKRGSSAARWFKGAVSSATGQAVRDAAKKGEPEEPATQAAAQRGPASGTPTAAQGKKVGKATIDGDVEDLPLRGAAKVADDQPKKGLATAEALEDFFGSGLLQADATPELKASQSEPIASVIGQMLSKRQTACIVTSASGQQEYFDCMDFCAYLVESLSGSEEWEATKRKLKAMASEPIGRALRSRGGRGGQAAAGADSAPLGRFDSTDSLGMLLPQLRTHRAVGVFRQGHFCRTVRPGELLELCFSVSEESKNVLERTHLSDLISSCPKMLAKQETFEDQTLTQVMKLMRDEKAYVVPILASEVGDALTRTASTDSVLPTGPESGTLVGQFEVGALRAIFAPSGQEDADAEAAGQWWWEDNSIRSNIFMETCTDFMALAPSLVVDDKAAYAAVLSSEPLARAISRAIATSYQSVVVYHVDGGRTDGTAAGNTSGKPLAGLVSPRDLMRAMLDAGIFQALVFDTARPRRALAAARKPTLTAADVQRDVLRTGGGEEPAVNSKVSFSNVIELDVLSVPTCSEHGLNFMRFAKDDDPKGVFDFHALKDWVSEAKACGCAATCLACRRPFGSIFKVMPVIPPVSPPAAGITETPSPGLGFFGPFESFGSFLAGASDKAAAQKGTPKTGNGSAPPGPAGAARSALKAGTAGAASRTGGTGARRTSKRASGGSLLARADAKPARGSLPDAQKQPGFLGGFCCVAPCAATRSQIPASMPAAAASQAGEEGGDQRKAGGRTSISTPKAR